MAVKDTSRKPYIQDNDDNQFIGLDLPIRKGIDKQGYFESTSTTIEAVKNNIKNLLYTSQGERLMQPVLGINLRQYLFQQISDEMIFSIQNSILDTFQFWLPFVEVRDIQLSTNKNTIRINIIFNIKNDPNTLDSVQLLISEDPDEPDVNIDSTAESIGGGTY